ncbi:PLDc N-terminal domain-containing protein [Pseudomonas sp. MPFS]|uniref:PLDc N-terminal domain-containing protein n=1 Tax=Pseudomonas sp. MPFS TaxID=2795724 RepID=UPI001F12AF51|nr:PLDc N-terminal domain-containing protein [Pseudomonas sp. MPFS]UMZ14970.1 PLDc N-terminal domain-containing protein [Pseudomonas sp. MPFS]
MLASYLWIGLCAILLLLDLWAINSIWRSDNSSGSKALWTALVVLLPVLGLVLWGVLGPRGVTKGPSSPEHSKG